MMQRELLWRASVIPSVLLSLQYSFKQSYTKRRTRWRYLESVCKARNSTEKATRSLFEVGVMEDLKKLFFEPPT